MLGKNIETSTEVVNNPTGEPDLVLIHSDEAETSKPVADGEPNDVGILGNFIDSVDFQRGLTYVGVTLLGCVAIKGISVLRKRRAK